MRRRHHFPDKESEPLHYLDHEFRFETAPLLLVPLPGTTVSRAITSPTLKAVDRFSLASGT